MHFIENETPCINKHFEHFPLLGNSKKKQQAKQYHEKCKSSKIIIVVFFLFPLALSYFYTYGFENGMHNDVENCKT